MSDESRIEAAKAEVQALLQGLTGVDSQISHGQLVAIGHKYGLVVTTTGHFGVEAGARYISAGVTYDTETGLGVDAAGWVPVLRVGASGRLDLSGLELNSTFVVLDNGRMSITLSEGVFDEHDIFTVDVELGLRTPFRIDGVAGVSFAFTDLSTFLDGPFREQFVSGMQARDLISSELDYQSAVKNFISGYEQNRDFSMSNYLDVVEYTRKGLSGQVTFDNSGTDQRYVERLDNGDYLVTFQEDLGGGTHRTTFVRVNADGHTMESNGYVGFELAEGAPLRVTAVFGSGTDGLRIVGDPLEDAQLIDRIREEVIDGSQDEDIEVIDGQCFAAGTPVRMADGTEKPIEQIKIGEWVMAFDGDAYGGRGALVPSQVTRTMVNHGQLLLDFHGTKVTPGHVFLTGDESPTGKGVFKRLIDILIEDGTVVNAEGTVLRAATNFPVGSTEDRFVEVAEIWPENGSIGSRPARLRAGTWLIAEDGRAVTLLDTMTREGFELLPDGRVSHRGGPSQPMLILAPAPRPETYVLKRSGLTLEQIYAHASLRDVAPATMAARASRRTDATTERSGEASDGFQLGSGTPGSRLPQGWTPSADDDNTLPKRADVPRANRAARRQASAWARKRAKQRLH